VISLNALGDADAVQALAKQLQGIPKIARVVGRDDLGDEAWAIATGLKDIQESCSRIFQQIVPGLLTTDPRSSEAEALLYDLGEHYRHIHYHITETRFFGYVKESPGAEEEPEGPV
jgi:hypothetical protein